MISTRKAGEGVRKGKVKGGGGADFYREGLLESDV